MLETVEFTCYPENDEAFATTVRRAVLSEGDAHAAEAAIATLYPRAVIREMDALAVLGPSRRWYAFRDGSFIATVAHAGTAAGGERGSA